MEGPVTRRRLLTAGLAGWLAMVGLAACGGSGDRVRSDGGERGTTQAGQSASAGAYVGLTEKDAIAKADAAGRAWRITREDDEEFFVTFDYDPERVNLEIDDGTVTRATFG
jgi:hypothetical protein